MIFNPARFTSREKQILAGLFLSKFDTKALNALGFGNFTEAFNALGYALGGRPASIKNYRDEFDPLFPNPRQGWRHRNRRDYCMRLEKEYGELAMEDFAKLVAGFVGASESTDRATINDTDDLTPTSFAKRMITGKAAEQYFQAVHQEIQEFQSYELEDTTAQGCGYDFRLWPKAGNNFKAVEVKGMVEQNGCLSLTEKEYECASVLEGRFYLFVVKNFREKPFHEIHPNPLAGRLIFTKKERRVVQVSWTATA